MKRYVKLLSAVMALLVIMAFTLISTIAETEPTVYEYVEGWGTWYYIVEDGGATLTNYGGDGESFYLPDTLGGYPLKVIGESACAYLDWLTEVDIPDSVVELCYGAFDMCTFLKTVNMGDNLEVIGEAAFRGCESLTDVNFGAGVKVIENNAFDSCSSLKEIAIPDGVEVLQDRTFDRCSGLQSVYLPDSIYFIGNDAFSLCESLREITIPEGVVYIGENAFSGCIALTSVTIPGTVDRIEMSAFENCRKLSSVVLAYSGRLRLVVETNAFANCTGLTNVWYGGTEVNKRGINIHSNNDAFQNANWYYDCTELEVQYDEEVEHSTMDTESGTGLAFKFDLSVSVGVKNGNEVDYTDATIEYMGYTCKLVGMGSVVTNRADVDPVLENVNGTYVIDIPVVYLTEWDEDSCSLPSVSSIFLRVR